VASTTSGVLTFLNNTNANTLNIQAGATGATITYTLPATAPTTGQVLSSTSGGVMSWATASGGSTGTGLNLTGTTFNMNIPVIATHGGTGQTFYAVGDIPYSSGTTSPSLTRLASVSAGSYLRSGGVDTAPVWSTTKLLNAGTANYIPYWSSTNTQGESANLQFNGTSLGIGMAPVEVLDITKNQNAGTIIQSLNNSAGTSAFTGFILSNGTSLANMYMTGTGFTPVSIYPQAGFVFNTNGAGGMVISASNAAGIIKFITNGTTERMRFTANGELLIGGTALIILLPLVGYALVLYF